MRHSLPTLLIAVALSCSPLLASSQDFDSQNSSVALLADAAHNLYVSLSDKQKAKGAFPNSRMRAS